MADGGGRTARSDDRRSGRAKTEIEDGQSPENSIIVECIGRRSDRRRRRARRGLTTVPPTRSIRDSRPTTFASPGGSVCLLLEMVTPSGSSSGTWARGMRSKRKAHPPSRPAQPGTARCSRSWRRAAAGRTDRTTALPPRNPETASRETGDDEVIAQPHYTMRDRCNHGLGQWVD